MPTFPAAVTFKNVAPEEEAALKISRVGLVVVPCATKVA
jgi:hypothetical protein